MAGLTMQPRQPIAVETASSRVEYRAAEDRMDRLAEAIWRGEAKELLWLLEHPPLFTSGTSARAADFVESPVIPVFRTRRGGQITYHGPGQRIAYILMDLRARGLSVRDYVAGLETWLINALQALGVEVVRRCGRVGVWVPDAPGGEAKIAAIGIAVRHGVAMHGIALNVDPDLSAYDAIVPCGVRDYGVTSLAALGRASTLTQVDAALLSAWPDAFGALSITETRMC